MNDETDIVFAVENMFPWRALSQEITAYAPSWGILDEEYANTTVDLSHTSVSQTDALELVRSLGTRVAHMHLADGQGTAKDEHLVPGRGTQPVAQVLAHLAGAGFSGNLIVEVNTRAAQTRQERTADLAEALTFTRTHSAPMAG
jgi:sugar phosphate isomerase/epimerase